MPDVIHPSPPSGPSAAPAVGPERVRELRGTASRAAFARRLGVTPYTVYRWELPDGAREARRPRGSELKKLLELSGEAPPALEATATSPNARATAEDIALVLPTVDRAYFADPRRAHDELVLLLVKRQGLSADALALARFGVAVLELLGRADPRAALLV